MRSFTQLRKKKKRKAYKEQENRCPGKGCLKENDVGIHSG